MAACLLTAAAFADDAAVISIRTDSQSYPVYKTVFACDGNKNTFWHTEFEKSKPAPPHWVEFDLKNTELVRGVVYTPRQDSNNNGTFCQTEIRVYANPEQPGECVWTGNLDSLRKNVKDTVKILFDKPVEGRFVKVTVLSTYGNQPFASAAELQPIVDGKTFTADSKVYLKNVPGADPELISQYNLLLEDIDNRQRYDKIAGQIYDPQAGILPEDKTPVDVIYRRTLAAVNRLEKIDPDLAAPFLAELKALNPAENKTLTIEQSFALFEKIAKVRRRAMFADPDLDFDKLLFVKKHRATFNHLCDQYYGVNILPGGGIFMLENAFDLDSQPTVKNVLENSVVESGRLKGDNLKSGGFATLALDYDAQIIAFAYVEATGDRGHKYHTDLSQGHWERGRCLHIFTANVDGTDVRQITDGTWNDFYPCFLPNGRLAFISERRGGYLRCGRECPNYTIFDMNPDGTLMRCLSYHETNEWAPSVSNDGKIVWTRWDYIDRHGCTAHTPWIMTLNGSDPRAIHGNFTLRRQRADTEMDIRAIPNSSKFVATAGPHHGQNYGSLIIIDPSRAPEEETDAMACTKRLTPDVDFPESQGGAQVWGFAYPISEDLFLAVADYSVTPSLAMQGGKVIKGNYGIYLLDRFGNRELIYRDPEIGCASVLPFVKRTRQTVAPELVKPGEIPSQEYIPLPERDWTKRPQAEVTIANVYQSLKPWPEDNSEFGIRNSELRERPTGADFGNRVVTRTGSGASPTKIKALRIVQLYAMSVPSGWGYHTGRQEPSSMDSVNLVRGVIGTVPVEEDGSAHFTVPAQVELLFQALDENGNAVQSMRSGTYFQPGDNVSCVGCHEPKGQITRSSSVLPLAFTRPASVPVPDVDGSRPANFIDLVQPVLDKHCVECHEKPESKTFSLAGKPYYKKNGAAFYHSYYNLMYKGWGFYDYGNSVRTIPGQYGALKSPLLPLLDKGHYGVELSAEERHRIALWLDMLSPFFSVYEPEQQNKQLQGEKVYPTLE